MCHFGLIKFISEEIVSDSKGVTKNYMNLGPIFKILQTGNNIMNSGVVKLVNGVRNTANGENGLKTLVKELVKLAAKKLLSTILKASLPSIGIPALIILLAIFVLSFGVMYFYNAENEMDINDSSIPFKITDKANYEKVANMNDPKPKDKKMTVVKNIDGKTSKTTADITLDFTEITDQYKLGWKVIAQMETILDIYDKSGIIIDEDTIKDTEKMIDNYNSGKNSNSYKDKIETKDYLSDIKQLITKYTIADTSRIETQRREVYEQLYRNGVATGEPQLKNYEYITTTIPTEGIGSITTMFKKHVYTWKKVQTVNTGMKIMSETTSFIPTKKQTELKPNNSYGANTKYEEFSPDQVKTIIKEGSIVTEDIMVNHEEVENTRTLENFIEYQDSSMDVMNIVYEGVKTDNETGDHLKEEFAEFMDDDFFDSDAASLFDEDDFMSPGSSNTGGVTVGGNYKEEENWKDYLSGDTDVNVTLMKRLAYMAKMYEKTVYITSGYRSRAEQVAAADNAMRLYKSIGYYQTANGQVFNKYGQSMVAPPGTSKHQSGLAVDVSGWLKYIPNSELKKYGLWKPMSYENWHIEVVETVSTYGKK